VRASSSRKQPGQWSLVAVYALFLLIVSVLPGNNLPKVPDWFDLFGPDKVAHFGAYGVFALLLSVAPSERRTKWPIAKAVFLAALYGALMEILQGISGTGRHFDPVDMVANLLGAILGGLAYAAYTKFKSGVSQR